MEIIKDFNGIYTGVVPEEFIEHRNGKVATTVDRSELNKYRRWDSEFPEWDIVNHIKGFTRYPGNDHDIDCVTYNQLDFKIFAKIGVKVNTYPVEQVLKGNINYFAVWKWVIPWEIPLKANQETQYEILGLVDAKEAINALQKVPNKNEYRFPFNCVQAA